MVRAGDVVYATGLDTLPGVRPLNNCRWTLFRRDSVGWKLVVADPVGRTREPSPLAVFSDQRVFLSANPTLVTDAEKAAGPARPEIFEFPAAHPEWPFRALLPEWQGAPEFTEHSYRSLAADGPSRELILFQNVGYTHAEWAFLNSKGTWSAQGRLRWPDGRDYEKPQPVRICYPNVALRNRSVYFCGVSDIIEPRTAWRAYKKELTGQEWDYDFRRLFFTWTPDVEREPFRPWTEVVSRESTCGWITPGDLWVAADGLVHVLWTERAIDERLRERFFPSAKQRHALEYACLKDGQVVRRHTLMERGEGLTGAVATSSARFHATPDGRLFALVYVVGTAPGGEAISENRLLALSPEGVVESSVRLALQRPFTSFFTATPRAGSAPVPVIDLLGHRTGSDRTLSYARLRVGAATRP
jgi:hypothetical protein